MDPIVVSMASDLHGDKRDRHGRFVDNLDLVHKDALACIRLIYGSKRCGRHGLSISDVVSDVCYDV